MKTSLLCFAILGTLSLSACEGPPQDETDVGGAAGTEAQTSALYVPITDGYWLSSSGKVFDLHDGNRICWVYDDGQFTGLTHDTNPWGYLHFGASTDAILMNNRIYEGHCRYPSGMYRVDGTAPVYLVRGDNTFCHVYDPAQVGRLGGWGAVQLIKFPDSHADLSESRELNANFTPRTPRTFTGFCPN